MCQRKLQVLDEKLGTLKSNDSNYSSIEDIKKIIQKLYSRLPRIEDVGMKTEIKAKVDSALSICNRFSFKDNRMNYLKKSRNESSLPERDYVRWQDGDSKRQWCLQKCGDVDCGGGPEFLDFGIKKLLEETANFVASLDKDIDRHGGLNEKNSFYSESMKIIKNDIDKISNHILSLGSVAQELVDSS